MVRLIQYQGIAVFKLEHDAPIAIYPDRPTPMTSPFERVRTETGNLPVRDRVRGVEGGQLHFEARCAAGASTRHTHRRRDRQAARLADKALDVEGEKSFARTA